MFDVTASLRDVRIEERVCSLAVPSHVLDSTGGHPTQAAGIGLHYLSYNSKGRIEFKEAYAEALLSGSSQRSPLVGQLLFSLRCSLVRVEQRKRA